VFVKDCAFISYLCYIPNSFLHSAPLIENFWFICQLILEGKQHVQWFLYATEDWFLLWWGCFVYQRIHL